MFCQAGMWTGTVRVLPRLPRNRRRKLARFPFATLDEFLTNLDGDPNPKGDDYLGSFDWRYLFPAVEVVGGW